MNNLRLSNFIRPLAYTQATIPPLRREAVKCLVGLTDGELTRSTGFTAEEWQTIGALGREGQAIEALTVDEQRTVAGFKTFILTPSRDDSFECNAGRMDPCLDLPVLHYLLNFHGPQLKSIFLRNSSQQNLSDVEQLDFSKAINVETIGLPATARLRQIIGLEYCKRLKVLLAAGCPNLTEETQEAIVQMGSLRKVDLTNCQWIEAKIVNLIENNRELVWVQVDSSAKADAVLDLLADSNLGSRRYWKGQSSTAPRIRRDSRPGPDPDLLVALSKKGRIEMAHYDLVASKRGQLRWNEEQLDRLGWADRQTVLAKRGDRFFSLDFSNCSGPLDDLDCPGIGTINFSQCTHLTYLNLSGRTYLRNILGLERCKQLKDLNLARCGNLSGEIWGSILQLKNLEKLELSDRSSPARTGPNRPTIDDLQQILKNNPHLISFEIGNVPLALAVLGLSEIGEIRSIEGRQYRVNADGIISPVTHCQ